MQSRIQKWGNSLAIRIPLAFVKETGLAYGTAVDISVEDGRIVIDPQMETEYTLEELLKGVRKDNLHSETDTGDAVGREVW
jgi:antitoxin MazE